MGYGVYRHLVFRAGACHHDPLDGVDWRRLRMHLRRGDYRSNVYKVFIFVADAMLDVPETLS